MKRILAIVLIIAVAFCGCAQRYDGSLLNNSGAQPPTIAPTPSMVIPEATEKQPQPSLGAEITGGIMPTPNGEASPNAAIDAAATAGQWPGSTPIGGASGQFWEDIEKGIQAGPVNDGFDVRVGSFSLAIPKRWKAAENYDIDAAVSSIDGVYRYTDGDDRLVISAIDMKLAPLDLDNEQDVARTIIYNTSYEWMEYASHTVLETPLGKALFVQVNISEDAPYTDEAYVGVSMLLPLGEQALNLGVSTPARASDRDKSGMWRLLGQLAGSAAYAEGGSPI